MNTEEQAIEIYDIKDIPKVPYMPGEILWLSMLAVAALILLALVFKSIYRRFKPKTKNKSIKAEVREITNELKLLSAREQVERLYTLLNNLQKISPAIFKESLELKKLYSELQNLRFHSNGFLEDKGNLNLDTSIELVKSYADKF